MFHLLYKDQLISGAYGNKSALLLTHQRHAPINTPHGKRAKLRGDNFSSGLYNVNIGLIKQLVKCRRRKKSPAMCEDTHLFIDFWY